MKWLRNGKISLVGTKDSKFDIDKGIYAIDFSNISKTGNKIEDRLIDIFSSIASVDKILYVNELRIWCGYNYSLIISWDNYIIVAFMLGISSDVIKNLKEFSIDFGTFNNFKADNLTSFGKNISFSVYNVSFDAYNVSLGGSFDSSGSFDGNRSSSGSGISSSSGGISAGGFSSRGGGGIR